MKHKPNERMIEKIIYHLIGLLVAESIRNASYNKLIGSGVDPSVAFPLSLGILAIVLAFWIRTLKVIIRKKL